VIATKPLELLRIRGERLRVIVEQHPILKTVLKEIQIRRATAAAEKLLGKT